MKTRAVDMRILELEHSVVWHLCHLTDDRASPKGSSALKDIGSIERAYSIHISLRKEVPIRKSSYWTRSCFPEDESSFLLRSCRESLASAGPRYLPFSLLLCGNHATRASINTIHIQIAPESTIISTSIYLSIVKV